MKNSTIRFADYLFATPHLRHPDPAHSRAVPGERGQTAAGRFWLKRALLLFIVLVGGVLVLAASGCATPKHKTQEAKPEPEKVHYRGWIGGEFKLAQGTQFFGSREDYVAMLPPGLSSSNRAGVLITGLSTNTPAFQAGLHEGDLILDCAHKPVTTLKAFHQVVDHSTPGNMLPLTVWREGKTFDCPVSVGREKFRNWGTFRMGFCIPNLSDFGHFDLWPNPGFDLWVVGFEQTPNDRKELASPEVAYCRACKKGRYSVIDDDWNAWLVIFDVNRNREILAQEAVPVQTSAVKEKSSGPLSGNRR